MSGEPSLETALSALRSARGRAFWRGLDDLIERADVRERLAQEFPALGGAASDWRRRDVLKCLGGALALAGLDGCERSPDEDALPYVVQPDGEVPGIARYYATAVELDGIAQPVMGKTRMARPIKLEGNLHHPASGGATDAFTQAALLGLYDPERSKAPAFRGSETDWTHVDAAISSLRAGLDKSGGAGFRLLTGPVGSPTLQRQIGEIMARWPRARWHEWSPLQRRTQGLLLDSAQVVVALDDDIIGPGPFQTCHARRWAERRRAYQAGQGSALMFVAEPSPTITGVTATDRLPVRQDRIAVLISALEAALDERPAPAVLNTREAGWIKTVAKALDLHRGQGVIALGAHHAADLHDAVRRIAARLGNPQPDLPAEGEDLSALVADMSQGAVTALFVLDANPVYANPSFAPAMKKVRLRIHAGLHADETAAHADWHLPLAHALESWSDGRCADGSATITQPLVRPWLAVRSRHALLSGLLGAEQTGLEIVRQTWELDDERWRQTLLQGWIAAPPPAAAASVHPITKGSEVPAPRDEGLTVIVRPDPCVWDGQFASNPWLQELPKPLTKIAWGSAIHVSPALAQTLELRNEDVVRLSVGDRSVEGPVWILPGQQRDTILVHLGHGRTLGGRVAQGIGFNAWPLVGATGEVRLEKTGRSEQVASTQHHFAMEDDEFVRFVDAAGDKLPQEPPRFSFFPPQKSSPAWGMAIDLDLCIGCNACVVACVAENNIPMVGKEQVAKGREMHWIRVDRYYEGSAEDPEHVFQPVTCMHCEDAPCEMGCPVNATVHSPEGLNLQVYNRCIGTRTCSAYCPYKVRRFNWFDLTGGDPPELRAVRNPEVTVRGRGVMEKCTYCIQRISAARIEAKKEDRPIAEGEVVTACQAACPTQAIVFGDVSRAESAVSKRKANGRDYELLREANTRPRTTYQARIRRGDMA
ncbi:molybdopterin-containing oxidoreductase family iron-sulfur binding subunit [Novosphingobium sp. PhB165]|uniref:TAT-variant-translocated molybdopterin oxidoreductase n=1 Tax=Novosphingobium sp. PhB165 TaxID=2485105 RepID=UPI001044DBD7|nr:TAT-variant-translocated molybdopterin oxidoreductase [Novosphingobium sp. PhB165]TCM14370.1 molybdopterin-containing oxidoreductase family iron-sulfur binding subunit [Novosphingobium sp. PhB165]